MSTQTTLDLRERVDTVLEAVDGATDTDWKAEALDAVRRTCEDMAEFISDEIWSHTGLASTREDRALGPIMRTAARMGWCVKTCYTRPSKRSNLSGKPVWKSRLYRGGVL